jgi:hypothetical protein
MRGQDIPHVSPNAVHMDMKLLLGAAVDGVDGEGLILAGQRLGQLGLHKIHLLPGIGEIVGDASGQKRRAFDGAAQYLLIPTARLTGIASTGPSDPRPQPWQGKSLRPYRSDFVS